MRVTKADTPDQEDDDSIAYMSMTRPVAQNGGTPTVISTERNSVDWVFVLLVGLLATLGLVMVFSASISLSERLHEDAIKLGRNQTMYLCLGIAAVAVVWKVPLQVWERYGAVLLGVGLLSLCVVLIPGVGKSVNGAQRWIDIGVSVQPSEFFKLAIVLYLAGFLVRKGEQIRNDWVVFATPLLIAVLAAALLLNQPDFGATVVVTFTILAMMFIAGVRMKHFFIVFSLAIPVALAAIYASPYRRTRLMSFTNPWDDPFDTDFQLTQALIAIGRGSFNGVGLGNSVQKMAYLPEPHTDFVFAVTAEELGLVGVTIVLSLFALIVSRCFRVARNAERAGHLFASHMVAGIGFWLGFQTFINIGANMGVLPTKGITLPLFSYGGTSVLAVCIAFALVLRAHREVAEFTERSLRKQVESRLGASAGHRQVVPNV
ncbi:MAG: putative lipid II flippase FtsW [Pseudomonadota bacterium]